MARRQIQQAEIVHFFAERLREVRLSRNMTQAELAQRASLPSSYISDLEQAKVAPGIDLVARLAKSLETTVSELLPPPAPPESVADLQKRARQLLKEVSDAADRDVLLVANSVLTLLRELVTRRS